MCEDSKKVANEANNYNDSFSKITREQSRSKSNWNFMVEIWFVFLKQIPAEP